ncbi:WD repeat and FYVE domain-containing protein 3 [Gossypium australe]|uniref:WD repeat and FYVE domain-containing protein 3 n=1 Tax=Gossypium australe TaxID=47621 RepID=A0A5B6WQ93_9ROSI|nr:WD repeat and FYVE domain-containing protein 3 [Gossypium australe]
MMNSSLLLMIWVNPQRPKQFFLYYPVVGKARGNRIYNDVKFTTMITKVHKVTDPNDTIDSVGLKLFDDLCPIEFKFDELFLSLILEDKDHFEVEVRPNWVAIWPCKWPIIAHAVEHMGVCPDPVLHCFNLKLVRFAHELDTWECDRPCDLSQDCTRARHTGV